MRRVETVGDSRGVVGRVARPGPSRERLRRASLESLERRELLSTLPTPAVAAAAGLVSTAKAATSSASSPSVAVNPVDPRELIATWVVRDTVNPLGNGQVTSFVQGAFSTNGGLSWQPLGGAGSANVQADFSVSQANGPVFFAQTGDASVAFGRDETAYLLTSTTRADRSVGVLDLQAFSFVGAAPTQTLVNKEIYAWSGADAASTPVIAVDNNVASFSDVDAGGVTRTQVDPHAGNVYVAWASTDTNRGANSGPITNFNPQSIKVVASSDNGLNFSHAAFVDNTSNFSGHSGNARYVTPSIAISQGTTVASGASVPGGQVTIVYDDYGTGATAGIPFDRIVAQVNQAGGADAHFEVRNQPISLTPGDTDVTFNVGINDPKFATLSALDVTLKLAFPNLAKIRAVLIPPASLSSQGFQPITLFNNGVDAAGAAVNVGSSLAGQDLGSNAAFAAPDNRRFNGGPATVFNQEAIRGINDSAPTGRYVGHYRPIGNAALLSYRGLTAAQLAGTWTLRLSTIQAETGTTGNSVALAALDFTSGNTPGATRGEVVVANNQTMITATIPNINPLVAPTTVDRFVSTGLSADPNRATVERVQSLRALPNPVVASDNTLGAYSPHQGRIYVAYTGRYDGITGIATDQTDIFLMASDDGGLSWSAITGQGGVQVNDDNGAIDGFSGSTPGTEFGRPQLQPQVAVDQSTGSVVVSFLDTRNDAFRGRVATYVAVSSDGGESFAPQTYANPTRTAVDAITGEIVDLGPVPDNQTAGSNQDAFGFGQHQGLAVAGGRIIPVWSSNLNAGYLGAAGDVKLAIRSSVLTTAAGPRILSGTMGPVGEAGDTVNTRRSALDGSPVADTIVVEYDRPIDPTTFGPDDVRVFFQDPYGAASGSVTTPLAGFFSTPAFTSVITLAGHPGVPIASGRVNVRLSGFADLGTVSVVLTAPNGRTLAIPTVAGTTSLDATVAIPRDMIGGAVDGSYVLSISSTPGQGGTFLGWSLQLNGVSTPLPVLDVVPLDAGARGATRFRITFDPTDPGTGLPTGVGTYSYIVRPTVSDRIRRVGIGGVTIGGNAADQNFDGVAGQDPETTPFTGLTPGDDFITPMPAPTGPTTFSGAGLPAGPYSNGALPLIVPGAHVVGVVANGVGGATSGSTPDHLILDDKVNSVDIRFDRLVQVATVTPQQILGIVGPAGSITGPQSFASNGVLRTFASADVGRAIPKGSVALFSSLPIATTGLSVADVRVRVNITSPANANLALALVAPDGTTVALVAQGAAAGANFSDTTFSDTPGANGLAVGIGAGRAPYGLTYVPSQAGGLAALRGKILDGTWRLIITDASAAGTTPARLNNWSLSAVPLVADGGTLDTPLAIPDFGGSFTIDNLAVRVNISAPKASDLSAFLVAPDGTVVSLFANPGGVGAAGANFLNVTFDPNASLAIQSVGSAPYTLTYRPFDRAGFATLASLRGRSLDGTWLLRVVDNFGNGLANSATVNSFSLIATPRIGVTPVGATTTSPSGAVLASTYRVSFPTQQLSGTYAVTVGAGVLGADPSLFNPQAPPPAAGAAPLGAGVDPNLNAGVDVLRGSSTTGALPTTTVVYPATGVPVGIPSASAGGVLASTLVVPDGFLIQPIVTLPNGARVGGLVVQLNITYPTDQDLAAVLIAPDGTRINLFTRIGVGTSNFNNTIFDDTVNPPASIRNAGNGFFGRYNPETPLGNLAGLPAGGTWTLEITNVGTSTGQLLSWSLTFQRPVPSSGLGDPVADRQTVNFRIFNLAPANPLANDTWTAVGPAGVTVTPGQAGTFAGPVATLAYDPSDPTRNTVYVGAASGGIWKTNNFLTTESGGPTYIPLTDLGPNFSLNVGSIAVFGRSGDPDQSILFAGTGFAQATYPYDLGGGGAGAQSYPNYGGPAGRGVGFLRSFDGGRSWTLLDSTVNVDAAGNPLPISSPARDRRFVGDTTYKVVVDPTALPDGNLIVYAALGGPTGGLYRSLDTGRTWVLLRAGTATDVILDPNSRSPSSGNIDIIYAAFQGEGVYISNNRGQGLALMAGMLGRNPLIQGPGFPAASATVGNATVTPNGAKGRIVLAKPALTGNAAVDLLYQDWLYAAVATADGHLDGLYITKDRGQNWTRAQLLNVPDPLLSITPALPSNDNALTTTFDPTGNDPTRNFFHNGNYDLTLAVDPTDPNIVYLGGTQNFQVSGLIRVDLTAIRDAHNLVSFANDRNDGGTLTRNSSGGINVFDPINRFTAGVIYRPPLNAPIVPGTPFLNFRHAPNTNTPGTTPFDVNGTLVISGRAGQGNAGAIDFNNDGTGVKWSLIDEPLKANAGDLTGSTNLHYSTAVVDPLTGVVRLIFANDQGVFTALLNADGSLNNGIGNAVGVNYSRNGNLQNQQFYFGAAQPSDVAAQAAGALFYASGQGLLRPQSDANVLANGNLTWNNNAVLSPPQFGSRDTAANAAIVSADRGGVGIATDQTGGVGRSGPAVYEYDVPSLGGNLSDFFRVNDVGRTTGLDSNFRVDFPFGNFRADGTSGADAAGAVGNGQIPLGNFAVNPLDGAQILIGSSQGVLFQTVNTGNQWSPIGTQADFDGTQLSALTYGAPDPNGPGGVGNLNNFIYVGTAGRVGGGVANGGHIYVTQTGGQSWIDISSGLDGGSVLSIYPSPNRGSHAAYAVTLNGVFFTPDSLAGGAGGPTWINITGNLAQIQHAPFGDPALTEATLAPFASNSGAGSQGTGAYGGFRSIVADYRYSVPDPVDPTRTYPVIYVAGFGGVFRTLDNGQTWTSFPNIAFDAAPVDGGYLPSVLVTDLDLNLGAINPATGRPTQGATDRPILMATTFGRGVFAIGLAPDVFPSTIRLSPTLPAPGGSDTGLFANDRVTNVAMPVFEGYSEISNFGNVVTITLIDLDNPDPATNVIGTGFTDANGFFAIRVGTFVPNSGRTFQDPSFLLDGTKRVGIQATDSSGATGNVTTFVYTFKATRPATPGTPTLAAGSDSGRSLSDNLTNVTGPTFNITTGEPATSVVNLFRFNPDTGQFDILVGSAQGGVSPVSITDTNLAALIGTNRVYTNLQYQATQVDLAGNVSLASGVLTVALKNTLPPALAAPTLDPASNSGLNPSALITNDRNPFFNVTGLESPQSQVFLFRSIGGATPINVGFAEVGATRVRDIVGATVDGTYLYQAVQIDIFGNISPLGQGVAVTINTQAPAAPSLSLFPADDTGAPARPGVTRVRAPRFQGSGTPGLQIVVYAMLTANHADDVPLAETVVSPDGSYLASSFGPLDDGTYTLVARTINAAGNISYSPPLIVQIRATPPQVVPTLSVLGVDDTGVKGDGVTANHRPRFVGVTDRGATVTLFSLVNGVLSSPQATATASTVNGSFQLQLPFNLVNGSTQLVAQATDVAGNRGPLSSPLAIRIVTVAGDYIGSGAAQFSVFRPTTETYINRGSGALQVDVTPGRDIPAQYDFNGDGRVDQVAYRFDAAQYFGFLSDGSVLSRQFGTPGVSLPVSGYYDASGTLIDGLYNPNTGTWAINLPVPGGRVVNFGRPFLDIPAPAAYDGGGQTRIAFFRPGDAGGVDGDSFYVLAPNSLNNYRVSFTEPAVVAQGFVYRPGDIPAPADYDGIGRDQFAVYRPTTGQFFILRVPDIFNASTWTLRTVTLNIPGGPKAGDVPVPLDYEGTGKASPTAFRPSTSTFYEIRTTDGVQQNIQFGQPGLDVASAGPLLYRLSALFGSFASSAGYPAEVTTTGGGTYTNPPRGGTARSASIAASATTGGTPAALARASTIALAMPLPTPVVAPAASVAVPVISASASASASTTSVIPAIPSFNRATPSRRVTVGNPTPKATVATQAASRPVPSAPGKKGAAAKAAPKKAAPPARPLAVDAAPSPKHRATPDRHQAAVAAALKDLGPIRVGRRED